MRILVGWDNPEQADLISMYVGVGDHEVSIVNSGEELIERLSTPDAWDVLFLSIDLPDIERGFEAFSQIRGMRPEMPVVGACRAADVYRVVRFMTHGMSAYAIRDEQGDFLFMLLAVLESAVEAVRALRDQQVAEKLREEVRSVRKLQESMIPAHIEAPAGCTIAARYEPSQIRVAGGKVVTMAGGDYYDVFTLDDNHIVLLVGDASGHGMKAAMSIMVMHTLVRMIRNHRYQNTAAFVAEINNQLCQHSVVNEEGGFITLCYGLLQLDTNELQWTSAGHPIPLVQDLATGEIRALADDSAGGLPLAIYPDVEYETFTHTLPDKYRLLFYTDGLQEAFPEHKPVKIGEFGVDGIVNTLRARTGEPVRVALQALFDDSEAYTEGSGRHDDTSAVLLERDRTAVVG
jgi:sigma-B regulation protein RsbU (phosphoserine phosphatase)